MVNRLKTTNAGVHRRAVRAIARPVERLVRQRHVVTPIQERGRLVENR